jgi:hypothetical protein
MGGGITREFLADVLESWTEKEATTIVNAVREHLKHQPAPGSPAVLDRLVASVAERRRRELMEEANDEEQPGEFLRVLVDDYFPDAIRRARGRLP